MIYFIGAGPGDPELLTLKARRLIDAADVILYTGSLVNPQVLAGAKPTAEIHDTSRMTLGGVVAVMAAAERGGRQAVRVHTGDPSLYGAVREQMEELGRLGIAYEVVPGVSSFLAAAASLKKEYTLPGVSQTLILTRMEGRTPVPAPERIELLAAHRASMAVFLSVGEIARLCGRLMAGGYPACTPAAVVYKASWPDEKVVEGTLSDIAQKTARAGITKTALVLIGGFLGDEFDRSKLYDENFSHGFRQAEGRAENGETGIWQKKS